MTIQDLRNVCQRCSHCFCETGFIDPFRVHDVVDCIRDFESKKLLPNISILHKIFKPIFFFRVPSEFIHHTPPHEHTVMVHLLIIVPYPFVYFHSIIFLLFGPLFIFFLYSIKTY